MAIPICFLFTASTIDIIVINDPRPSILKNDIADKCSNRENVYNHIVKAIVKNFKDNIMCNTQYSFSRYCMSLVVAQWIIFLHIRGFVLSHW